MRILKAFAIPLKRSCCSQSFFLKKLVFIAEKRDVKYMLDNREARHPIPLKGKKLKKVTS